MSVHAKNQPRFKKHTHAKWSRREYCLLHQSSILNAVQNAVGSATLYWLAHIQYDEEYDDVAGLTSSCISSNM
ncbi:hypothetical protein Y032_0073g778 [Ancylostoma ceylanicum]|uniref:Uncharacterized protein n=1 Tax=Ancylostoma ceylanicum TaxID=53326 RepID=A0A016TV66_9BILA|nr:hypothetical protein Y032_0073g778 [Ancylostoma ceylanicum]